MSGRVSILTENQALAKKLAMTLNSAGFEVQTLPTAPKFWEHARRFLSSLLVLDLDSMGSDAMAQCRRLRGLVAARLMAIASPQGEEQMLQAFEAGVDDYMSKPVRELEFVARIEALLRRRRDASGFHISRLPLGRDVTLDTDNRLLFAHGRRHKLTPIEYSLLDCLIRHAGQVVSRGTLLRHVWGEGELPSLGSLNLYIYYLRRKIERDPRHPEHILTKWGVGYCLAGAGNVATHRAASATGAAAEMRTHQESASGETPYAMH